MKLKIQCKEMGNYWFLQNKSKIVRDCNVSDFPIQASTCPYPVANLPSLISGGTRVKEGEGKLRLRRDAGSGSRDNNNPIRRL